MVKIKWLLIVSLVVILMALPILGACEEEVTPPGGEEEEEEEEVGPQYGGTLRVIHSAPPIQLGYPPLAAGPEAYYQRTPCIERLVIMNEKGEIVPFLAESYTEDPENLTITFKLREGIKFHDGSILDASVCKWNFDQLAEGKAYYFERVDSISVVDDNAVQIKFTEWDSVFMRSMAWISCMISQEAFEKNGGKEWAADNPVGTGPFKLVSFQRDVSLVYERFDDYWQEGKPYLDRVVINYIADPMVQVASFLAGENDIISRVDPSDAVTLKSEPGVVVTEATVTGGTLEEFFGDSANPDSPFSNIKVREALNYAIDRDAIAETICKGYAIPVMQLGYPTMWCYNPDLIPTYDPDKARELLEDAGYGDGFDTTITLRSDQLFQDIYAAVKTYLEAVDIRVTLNPVDPGKYGEITTQTGWPEGTCFTGGSTVDPETGRLWVISFTSPWPVAQLVATPQEFRDILDEYLSATDLAAKQELVWQLQDIVYNKYFLRTAIVAYLTLAAKYSYVHDEYTCDYDFYPHTFADAWIEK